MVYIVHCCLILFFYRASTDSLQAPTARDGEYSPYANYRIPLSDGPRSTVRQEPPVEDYYAQIRKKPAERTQSADLLVDIPPPKPQRQSLHQSDDRLYVPQQENMQRQRE